MGTKSKRPARFIRKRGVFGDKVKAPSLIYTKNRRFWGHSQSAKLDLYEKQAILRINAKKCYCDFGYTPMDDNVLTEYLWPIVSEIIKTAIENNQNLIVEGCYIPFDWQKDFNSEYHKNIKYYCLVMSDEYIKNHFHDIIKFANVIENRLDNECCTLESLLADNKYYRLHKSITRTVYLFKISMISILIYNDIR